MPIFNDVYFIKLLGFDVSNYFKRGKQQILSNLSPHYYMDAESLPNTNVNIKLMHMYTNIIQPHNFGEQKTNLLRSVPIGKVLYEEISHQVVLPSRQ